MLGRGIDQIMPQPGKPQLQENYVRDARDYVAAAVNKNGPIPVPVDFRWVWGDALVELERIRPDFKIINLETSVTASDSYWPNKHIHYRMHPGNVGCLTEAGINCAVVANNHVLDFGYQGLLDTRAALAAAGVQIAGAGANIEQASNPAVLGGGWNNRILVYACAHHSSGVVANWGAGKDKAGINPLLDCSDASLRKIKETIIRRKQPGDTVIFSVHWGHNWGYGVDQEHMQLARRLIDEAGIDVVHGHSSHHVKAIEIHNGKPILYGCGDFIDDYEGISGYEAFRTDLRLMYFLQFDRENDRLLSLQMIPMQMKRFRLQYAAPRDAEWLLDLLKREGEKLGTKVELTSHNVIEAAG